MTGNQTKTRHLFEIFTTLLDQTTMCAFVSTPAQCQPCPDSGESTPLRQVAYTSPGCAEKIHTYIQTSI